MPLELAEEWLALEAMIGMRPRVEGRDIPEIRENVAKARIGRPKSGPSSTLNIYDEELGDVKVRVYEPKQSNKRVPLAVFFHGGGFCVGDLDSEDAFVRSFAESIPIAVVSVEYRLAPEFPWPTSMNDCVKATRWAVAKYQNSHTVDNSKLLVCGTSAGAQLALATTAYLVQNNSSPYGIVVLAPLAIGESAVPSYMEPRYQSMTENADGPMVDKTLLDQFMKANGHDDNDPSFSVLLSPALAQFPPTYIATCGADPLRDDGVLLEEILANNNVSVKRDHYQGYPHMFWAVPGLKETVRFQDNLLLGMNGLLSRT